MSPEGTPRAARRAEAGYTLIEIMGVVAIIGILMSMLIYGAGSLRRKAMAEGSRAVVQNLKAAIDAYYTTYRAYPPDGYDTPVVRASGGRQVAIKGSQCLIYYLGFPTAVEVEVGQDVRVQEQPPFLEFSAEMLSGEGDVQDRLDRPDTLIVDRFGNEIRYDSVGRDPNNQQVFFVNDRSGPAMQGGDNVTAPDPRKGRAGAGGAAAPRNKGAYDLWSVGPDAADPLDDLTNWK